ncbi:MAG: sugar ABC transporter permease [Spirochaetes bacterium]|nr:sugar ABC transporter permease [Spirochaetota bacterium]
MLISRNIRATTGDKVVSWVFLLPVIIILAVTAFIPLGYGVFLSFHKFQLNIPNSKPVFIGFSNYIEFMKDKLFIKSLTNNIIFATISVSMELIVGLVVAMILSEDNKMSRVMITIILIPMIIAPVVAGTLWRMMLDSTYGVVDYFLELIHIPGVRWLSDPKIALYSVILVDFWKFTPYVAILLISSVKTIPRSFMDSARVDGASPWKLFYRIVLPIISPVIIIVAMIRFIDAFKVFDLVFVMTGGGPGNATEVLPTYIYREGIKYFRIGFASSVAVVFITVMFLVSGIFIRLRTIQLNRVE